MTDYYKILRINQDATDIEIKKAYRKLALEFHPDKNKSPNAHELFVKIVTAYEVLSNPIKRTEYDNYIKKEFESKKAQRTEQKAYERTETYSTEFNQNFRSQNAEKYANMTFREFEKFMEQIVAFGKVAKKTTQKGCAWIAAIILFPLGAIGIINNLFFEQNGIAFIFISAFMMFLGYGAYAMATEK